MAAVAAAGATTVCQFPKKGMMKKRGQGVSTFGVKNWKDRWFELTEKEISYWDKFGGATDGGTRKGSVLVTSIIFVEEVALDAFDGREAVFQIGHDDRGTTIILYVQAGDPKTREDWIHHLRHAASLTTFPKAQKYHASVFEGKNWRCCQNGVKTNAGCQKSHFALVDELPPTPGATTAAGAGPARGSTGSDGRTTASNTSVRSQSGDRTAAKKLTSPTQYRETSREPAATSPLTSPSGSVASAPASHGQTVPVESAVGTPYKVVVMYPYEPSQPGDLKAKQGDILHIIDDSEPNWWEAQRDDGTTGFIPSNYVVKQGLQSESWFHGKMGRSEAAALLRMAAFSGSFLVRESESKRGEYSLSVSCETTLKHYHIKFADNQYFINDRHHFGSIVDLVEYHKHNSGGLITRLRRTVSEGHAPATAGFGHNQWEIPKEDIKLGQLLGEGNWGKVHLAEYTKNSQLVAVKTLKNSGSIEQQEDFIAEAKVMMQCSHPHLVQLYGVSSTPPLYIITEFMKGGCLLDYLKDHTKELEEKPEVLTMMGIDVSSGMSFLEEKQFIHRDLAARNCLVGEDHVVKVADFGLARFVLDDEYTASEGTKFPVKWAAPEVINYNRFSTKSDVWSFGITLWEIWTLGMKPYPGMDNITVMDKVSDGYRMKRPTIATHDLHDIMMDCWHSDPDARPTFADLYDQLTNGTGAYAREEDLV
eukprot:m.286312 g.286312  ORF g.286312 m.286312 type:complete len:704 (+) comp27051_c0_seq2:220-2331(+)